MPNRSVSVRYILDASGYLAGAQQIKAADAEIAASARAAAAAMNQTQGNTARAQQNATNATVAGGKAQAAAATRTARATVAATRIIEDAERRKVRIHEDSARRIDRVQQDAAARMARTTNQTTRDQIAQASTLRQARIREDAATRAGRIGQDAGIRADRSGEAQTASLQARASAFSQVGHSALIAGGLIGAGLALSAHAAVQWQSDFTGVARVVGGSAESLNGLSNQLREMSRTLPESSTQIAAVATNAAQLGIKTPNIAAFTKTMVQLGDTTNLSSEEASTALAQLGNIMGTLNGPAAQVNDTIARTGSTIVGLGQNGASTEQQITDMGLRIASAGRTIGLNTTQVLGFASAVANTGVQAELGGTAISTGFLKIDGAVRQGGAGLNTLAKTSGMTADAFKNLYSTDSGSALTSFIEGLGRVQKQGGDTNGILRSLGITGARAGQVFRNLALSGNNVRDSLSNAAKSAADNTALTKASAARYETDAARISIAVNKIRDDAITAGGAALPIIASITDKVGKYADAYKALSPSTQGSIVKTAGISAGVLLIGGAALSAAGSVANLASNLKALGATGSGVAGVAKSLGTYGLVAAAGYAALQGVVAIQEHFIGRSTIASVDQATAAVQGLAKTGDSTGLNNLFKYIGQGNKGLSSNGLVKLTTDLNGVGDAFKVLNDPTAFDTIRSGLDSVLGTIGINAGKGGVKTAAADLVSLDQGLKGMATSGQGAQAAKAFAAIIPQATKAGESVAMIASQFPEYSKAVTNATEANGYHIKSDQELVDIMGGKVPPALAAAAKGNRALGAAVNAVTGANIGQTKTITQQFAAMQTSAAGFLNIKAGQIGMEQAITAANAALKQNGKTLDLTTTKGQQNAIALNNLGTASKSYVGGLVSQHANALKVVEANNRARTSYVKLAQSFGQNKAGAQRDANKIFALPKAITTQVAVNIKGASRKQIHDLNVDIQKLPKEQRSKVVATAETKGLKAAQNQIKEFKKPTTHKVKTEYDKGKTPPKPKDQNYKVHAQFANPEPPKIPKPKPVKIPVTYTGEDNARAAKAARTLTLKTRVEPPKVPKTGKGGTVNYKSKVDPPKPPKAGKGGTINYKSKADPPKAPKAPKGATITFKVKVDKVGKISVPKGGTVRIKTATDLSGVNRAKAGVNSVKGKTVRIKTSADLGGVNAARGAINSLPGSKTVTITTIHRNVTETVKRATGGKMYGPGTGTSDSIPVMASAGEWWIKERSSRYYGDSIMAAINAGAIPKSALLPYAYATGGKTGQQAIGVQAFAKGGKVTLSDLLRFANQPIDPLADVRQAEKDLAKIHKHSSKAYKDAAKALTDAAKTAAQAIRDFADSLTSGYRSASTSGADALALQQQGVSDLKALQDKVNQLQKLGLSNSEIARIVDRASQGDVAGASALADSIIEGGKGLVDQLNKSNKALEKIADALSADVKTKKTRGLAGGGQAYGPGTATSDTAGLYALSNREWVHPVAAVDYYGEAFMHAVQTRTLPRQMVSGHMAQGGQVGGVKVVTAPSNTADFVKALEGATFQIQNPWGPGYMDARVAAVADQRIGAAFTSAGSGR